jgi:hypothetical protein
MINVVQLEDLAAHTAATIQAVYDSVAIARKNGNHQVELPEKIDFQMIVIAPSGWQALESVSTEKGENSESGLTTGKETSTDKGEATDNQETAEKQGGFSTDTRKGAGSDSGTRSSEDNDRSENKHVQTEVSNQRNFGD